MTRGFGRFLRHNTIALLALFLALGGTTYAASTALIGKNTVASPQVVNGSLQTKDLSKKARKALKGNRGLRGLTGAPGAKGATGAQGVQGIQGVPGASATKLWASVTAAGVLTRGSGVTAVAIGAGGANDYRVTFNQDITNCVYLATGGNDSASQVIPYFLYTARPASDTVRVETWNGNDGTALARAFYLAVFC